MNLIYAIPLFVGLIGSAVSYKVLVFNPAYGASHSNFLGKISDILIDAGNEVTMLIPVYLSNKRNQTGSKKVTKIVEIGQDPRTKAIFESGQIEGIIKSKVWTMDPEMMSLFGIISEMNIGIGYQCEYIFQQTEILEQLRNENFDLAITESLFACPFAVFDHIGIKTVINAESNLFKDAMKYAHGEPAAISYFPGLFSPNNDKMSFFTRAKNLLRMMFTQYLFGSRYQRELRTIKPYYNGTESWTELVSNVAFYFINSNQYLDYASPTLPKTVFIGGMQVVTNKKKTKLNQEWDTLLKIRDQNVLISFGSNAHSCDMPEEFKKSFLEVFESMPDTTFIWKYEDENATLADHLPNVKLTKWMPQNDLLADDRLTLFVTHGGLGSTMELAYQGKPALIIPLLADQPRNAHMLTRHGGSLEFDKKLLGNSEELRKAIQMVLKNKKYLANAKWLAGILNSQPFSPKDVVLNHCNFAVEHGTLNTLSSEGKHLNLFQYYSFDIAIVFLTLAVVFLVLTVFILSLLLRFLSGIFKISMTDTPPIKKHTPRVRRSSDVSLSATCASTPNNQQSVKRRVSAASSVSEKKKPKRNSYEPKKDQYIHPYDHIFHWSDRKLNDNSYLGVKSLRYSGADIKLEEDRIELAAKTVLREKNEFAEKEFATLFPDDNSDDSDDAYQLSKDEDVADDENYSDSEKYFEKAKYVPLTLTTTGGTRITVPPVRKPYEMTKMRFVEPLTENVYRDDQLQLTHFPQFDEFPVDDLDYDAVTAFLHRTFPNGVHGNWRNKFETSDEMFYKTLMAVLPGTKNLDLLYHAFFNTFPSYGALDEVPKMFHRLHKKYSNGKVDLEILELLDSLKDPMKTKSLPYFKKFPFDVKYPDTRENFIVRFIKIAEEACSDNCYLHDDELATRMEGFFDDPDSKQLTLFILKSTKRQCSEFLNTLLMRDDKDVVKNFCQTAKLFPNGSCASWFKKLLDSASYCDAMAFQQKSYARRMENFRHAQKEDKKRRREQNKGEEDKYEDYTTHCDHLGPCGPGVRNCPCKRFCTVFCNCDFNCNRKFPGCECPPGKCQTRQCPCFEMDFECSELTCRQCLEDYTPELSSCDNYEMTQGDLKKIRFLLIEKEAEENMEVESDMSNLEGALILKNFAISEKKKKKKIQKAPTPPTRIPEPIFNLPYLTDAIIMDLLAQPSPGSPLYPVTETQLVPLTILKLAPHLSIPVLDAYRTIRPS
ncbi:Protein CBG08603 [Caenorhabditis briggsae]|uniref:glucuronosyltransferase n=1 Tax=Caenorhabditis briggsae TaxID=6238 RepID=A8X708_CAEBR|nr:Protein CBG08603 [Caenorhabditis briggsae]CAP28419.2 Protein CBG08603 [Caenorhabditis briggsae]